jgi:hypothetical protein
MLRTLPPLDASMILSIVCPLIKELPDDLYQRLVSHPYLSKKSSTKKYSTLPRNFTLSGNSPLPSPNDNFAWMQQQMEQKKRTTSSGHIASPFGVSTDKQKMEGETSVNTGQGSPQAQKSGSAYGTLSGKSLSKSSLKASTETVAIKPEPTTPMKATPRSASLDKSTPKV